MAVQWRKGRNKQVNIQTIGNIYFQCTYASKAMNGGRGQDTSKKTYSRYLLITYMHL